MNDNTVLWITHRPQADGKAALTNDGVRRSLEVAEEAIAVDHQHRVGRLELNGSIVGSA